MASLWGNIKKRRGSSHANLTTAESSKTQSARSSHNVSRDESSFRSDQSCAGDTSQEEMQPSEERWARISKLAEQVLHRPTNLPQVRLPPSFYKGLKSATLPRHFRTKSREAPIPPNTPEIQPSTSKQPSFESPRQVLKVFQKRAASVSPSRIEGENPAENPKHKSIRKSFRESIRGISAERLPKPIRNFIRSHKSKSLPPEKHPPKPSRRPGPVGKSWVKVYNDITYMDDPSVIDIQPIVGYTGHPTKVPDAQPLPAAPTPPPQRSSLEAKAVSTSSVESEYDNVPKRKRTHKPVPVSPVETEPKDNVVQHSTNVGDDNQQRSTAPTAATRTGRSREVSRYKGKRQKRTSTPINRPSISDLDDGGTPEREVEDHHVVSDPDSIVHTTIKPRKPIRESRIVPEANVQEFNISDREQPKESEEVLKQSKNIDNDSSEIETAKEEPYRPKRGIKIYESIIIIEKYVKKGKENNEVNETIEVLTPKPRKGIKIYETIQIMDADPDSKKYKVDHNNRNNIGNSSFEEVDIKNNIDKDEPQGPITAMPPRPTRGSKIYATEKAEVIENKKDESLEKCKFEERITAEKNSVSAGCNGDFDESEIKNKMHSIPLYAKVNKTRESMELSEKNSSNDSAPPPIPPKKRKLKNAIPDQESIYDLLPPRPQRHLKPKVRSLDPSPVRPQRLKTATLINGVCNTKSEIQNSKSEDDIFCLDDYGQRPSKPKRQTKVVKIEDVSRMTEENKVPLKPSRYTHGRLPAPPRRKKGDRPTTSDSNLESQREQIENRDYRKDHYENVDVINGKTIMKYQIQDEEEHSPPPLPKKKSSILETEHISEVSLNDTLINNTVNDNFKMDSLYRGNSIGECGKDENELYKSIDMNLKNIECSFETLDEVLKSLKSYSSSSLSRIIVDEKNTSTDNSKPIEIKDHSYLKGISIDDLATEEKHDLTNKEVSIASFDCDASSDISVSDEDTVISVGKNDFIEEDSDLLLMQDSAINTSEEVVTNCKPIKYKLSLDGDKIVIKENIVQKSSIHNANENLDQYPDAILPSDIVKKPSIYSTQTSTFEFDAEEESNPSSEVIITKSTSSINQESSEIRVSSKESLQRNDICNRADSESRNELKESALQESSENSSVIVCKFPLKLPTNVANQDNVSIVESVVTNIPLKLSTSETATFKFEQDLSPLIKTSEQIDAESPEKLSTAGMTTYKFTQETLAIEKNSSKLVSTEIPVKLSNPGKSTFQFESNLSTDDKVLAGEWTVTSTPMNLSSLETFKIEAESMSQEETSIESVVACIPVNLSTSDTSILKYDPQTSFPLKNTFESVVTEIPVKYSTPEITTFKFEPETSADFKVLNIESVVTNIPVKLSTIETTTFIFKPEKSSKPVVTEIPVKLSTSDFTTSKFEPEPEKSYSEPVIMEIPVKLSTSEITTFKFESEPEKSSSKPVVTEIPVKNPTPEITTFKFEPTTSADNKVLAVESVVTSIPVKLSNFETTTFKFEPEYYSEPVVTEIPVKLSTSEITTFKIESEPENSSCEPVVTEIPVKLSTPEITTFKFEPEPEKSSEQVIKEIPVKYSTPETTTFKFKSTTSADNKVLTVESVVTSIPVKLSTIETTTFKFEPENSSEPVATEIPMKLSTTEITTFKFESDPEKSSSEPVFTEIPVKYSTPEITTFTFEPTTTADNKILAVESVVTSIPVKLSNFETTTFKFEQEYSSETDITQIPVKLSTSEITTLKFESEPENSSSEPVVTEIPVKLSTPEITTFKFEPEPEKGSSGPVVTEIPVKLSTSEITTFKFESEPEKISSKPVVTEILGKYSTPEIATVKFEPTTSVHNKVLAVESVVTSIPIKLSNFETTTFKFEPEYSYETVVTEIPVKLSSSEITTFKFEPEPEKCFSDPVVTEIPVKLSTSEVTTFKFEPEPVKCSSEPIVTEIPVKLSMHEITIFKFESEPEKSFLEPVVTEIPVKSSTSEITTFQFEPEPEKCSSETIVTEIPVKLSTSEITTFKFEPESSAELVVTEIPVKSSTSEITMFETELEKISSGAVVMEIPVKLSTPEITFKFEPEPEKRSSGPVVTEIPVKLSTSEITTFKFESEPEKISSKPVVTEILGKYSTPEITTVKFEPTARVHNKVLAVESVVTSIPVKLSNFETTTFKFEPEYSSETVVTEIPVKLSTSEITTFKFESEKEKSSSQPVVTEIPVKLSTSEVTTFKFDPEPEKCSSETIVTEIPEKSSTFEITTFKFEPEPEKTSSETIVTEIPVKLSTSEITTFKFEPELEKSSSIQIISEIPLKLSPSEITTFKFEPEPEKSISETVITEIPFKYSTSEITAFTFEPETNTNNQIIPVELVVTSIPVQLSTLERTTLKFEPENSSEPVVTQIPMKLSTNENKTFKFEPEPKSISSEPVVIEIPVKLSTSEITTFKFEPEPEKSSSETIVTEIPVKLSTSEITTFKFEPELEKSPSVQVISEIPVKLSTSEITTFNFEPKPEKRESVVSDILVKLSTTEIETFMFEPENKPSVVESVATSINVKIPSFEMTTLKFESEPAFQVKVVEPIASEIPLKLCSEQMALSAESLVTSVPTKPSTVETAAVKFEHEPASLETASPDLECQVREIPLNLLATEIGTSSFGAEAVFPQEYAFVKIEIPDAASQKELSSTEIEIPSTSHESSPYNDNKLDKFDAFGTLIPDIKLENENSLHQRNEFSSSGVPTVSELASRLEGLRSQLEAVIINYPTSKSSSISSLDTALTDNASNRSSVLYTAPESPLSFYSPSQSTISMCSTPLTFYTAASEQSDGSLVLSDSDRTNTPSPNSLSSSIKADDEEQTSSGEETGEL